MNREEAIKEWIIPALKNTWNDKKNAEILKALEQEPCEDCISRKDTLAEFKRVYFDNDTVIRCAELVLGGMPPVTPQPCEDAISRQAAHEAIEKWAGSMSVLIALPTREIRPLLDSIHELPSVTCSEKPNRSGHWIDTGSGQECSKCHEIQYGYDNFRKYCPICGAKMVEPQESEVEE